MFDIQAINENENTATFGKKIFFVSKNGRYFE